MLIHGYASVNDLTVWRAIDESLDTIRNRDRLAG